MKKKQELAEALFDAAYMLEYNQVVMSDVAEQALEYNHSRLNMEPHKKPFSTKIIQHAFFFACCWVLLEREQIRESMERNKMSVWDEWNHGRRAWPSLVINQGLKYHERLDREEAMDQLKRAAKNSIKYGDDSSYNEAKVLHFCGLE